MPTNESNTRVSLRDFIEAEFRALDRLLEVKFNAVDAKAKASVELETQRWEAHQDVHKRERGVSAALITVSTAVLAWFGVKFPR